MKKHVLVIFFLALLGYLSAQKKAEFGLVLKAGTYTMAYQHAQQTYTQGITRLKETHRLGSTYAFGVYRKWPLSNHLSMSAELLYRYSGYSFVWDNQFDNNFPLPGLNYSIKRNFDVGKHNMSLPVKLHMSWRKDSRLTLLLGIGLSKDFASTIAETNRYSNPGFPGFPGFPAQTGVSFAQYDWHNLENFRLKSTAIAGFHYRIRKNSSIGLEFNYEGPDASSQNIDCLCNYGYSSSGIPNLKSFSLSLHHNMLR